MKNILRVLSVFMLVLALYFGNLGFEKKDAYYNSDVTNINAYVGGDAYNYIINGTYFTGYLVLSGSLLICSTMLFVSSIQIKKQKKTDNRLGF